MTFYTIFVFRDKRVQLYNGVLYTCKKAAKIKLKEATVMSQSDTRLGKVKLLK